jgi:hypothetical protein
MHLCTVCSRAPTCTLPSSSHRASALSVSPAVLHPNRHEGLVSEPVPRQRPNGPCGGNGALLKVVPCSAVLRRQRCAPMYLHRDCGAVLLTTGWWLPGPCGRAIAGSQGLREQEPRLHWQHGRGSQCVLRGLAASGAGALPCARATERGRERGRALAHPQAGSTNMGLVASPAPCTDQTMALPPKTPPPS